MYGTRPEDIAEVLGLLGEDVLLLSYEEQRRFASVSLNRFGAIGSARLDWHGADVVERHDGFDGEALASLLGAHAGPDELVVVFWDDLAVPSIALPASLAARHAEAILWVGYACWFLLTDSGMVIEFQDGEGLTAGRPPADGPGGTDGTGEATG
ncbi:hypothetical protein DEJ46_17695 [Streptomyces venezuelae]|uniref:Uncharacterized protein n=1 Tax=Streptomyces venezuelae TaxID=54571 RepID=A0A5P2ASZ2_STRVZ|nr:hypothetical protein DEJ46_17695 [Streptomyces venezuelae]